MDLRRQQKYRGQILDKRDGTAQNNWATVPGPQRPVWKMSRLQVANAAGIELIPPKVKSTRDGKSTKRQPRTIKDDSDESDFEKEPESSDYENREPGKCLINYPYRGINRPES